MEDMSQSNVWRIVRNVLIGFRTLIGVIPLLLLISLLFPSHSEPSTGEVMKLVFLIYGIVLLVSATLPSWMIIRNLRNGRHSIPWYLITLDLIIITALTSCAFFRNTQFIGLSSEYDLIEIISSVAGFFHDLGMLGMIVTVILYIECIYFLKRASASKRVWITMGVVLIATQMLMLLPRIFTARFLRPLVGYIGTHWISIPKDPQIDFNYSKRILTIKPQWWLKTTTVYCKSNVTRPWKWEGNNRVLEEAAPLDSEALSAYDYSVAVENNQKGAFKLLKLMGVIDPGLKAVDIPQRTHENLRPPDTFSFISPKAGGVYVVIPHDNAMKLFLYKDAEIP